MIKKSLFWTRMMVGLCIMSLISSTAIFAQDIAEGDLLAFASIQQDNLYNTNPSNLEKIVKESPEDASGNAFSIISSFDKNAKTKHVDFSVWVSEDQDLLIEVFQEDGRLVGVLHNDIIEGNKLHSFSLDGSKWNSDTHFLRVKSPVRIEHKKLDF